MSRRNDPATTCSTEVHWGERLVADFLDAHGIEWEYEPRTFVLESFKNGNIKKGFAPDFYLPAHDLYIEVTTAAQKNVTRKHQKVRLLQERHPEIRLQLLERRHIDRIAAGSFALGDLSL